MHVAKCHKCVLFFLQAAISPSLCSLSRLQVWPWINNPARRVSRTRWRGSLGWDPRGHRANRMKPNRPSLSLRLTSLRCAEQAEHLYMLIHTQTWVFSHRVLHPVMALMFFRSSTQTAVSATVFAWWTMCVILPKRKNLRRWDCSRCDISDTAVHIIFCVCQNLCVHTCMCRFRMQ